MTSEPLLAMGIMHQIRNTHYSLGGGGGNRRDSAPQTMPHCSYNVVACCRGLGAVTSAPVSTPDYWSQEFWTSRHIAHYLQQEVERDPGEQNVSEVLHNTKGSVHHPIRQPLSVIVLVHGVNSLASMWARQEVSTGIKKSRGYRTYDLYAG